MKAEAAHTISQKTLHTQLQKHDARSIKRLNMIPYSLSFYTENDPNRAHLRNKPIRGQVENDVLLVSTAYATKGMLNRQKKKK